MKTAIYKARIMNTAAGFILLSMIFMILVLPAVYNDSLSDEKNTGAAIGIAVAAALRFILFYSTLRITKNDTITGGRRKNRDYYIVLIIALLLLGFVYSDGAQAMSNNEPAYIHKFMFVSVFCDLIAAVLLLLGMLFFKKNKREI